MTPALIKGYICDKEDVFEWARKNEYRYSSTKEFYMYMWYESTTVHDYQNGIILLDRAM